MERRSQNETYVWKVGKAPLKSHVIYCVADNPVPHIIVEMTNHLREEGRERGRGGGDEKLGR